MVRDWIALWACVWVLVGASSAFAHGTVTISQGTADPLPVAFHQPMGESLNAQQQGGELLAVIQKDLVGSGLFRAVNREAFLERLSTWSQDPDYGLWRKINASALLALHVSLKGRDVIVEYKLWDTSLSRLLLSERYTTTHDHWRRIAHAIADDVYERLTGEKGYFDTRIVYVSESGDLRRRSKRLAIMDYDGFNHHFLASRSDLVLTPRFSPTMHQILYLSFHQNQAHVYLRDLQTGRESLVGRFQGMTYAPRFSPDGKTIIMSVAYRGNSDIYTYDLATGYQQRLTDHPAIDVSPSYSPDGQRIVFTSSRAGKPNLYIMGADGANPERISFGEGLYTAPQWSPRGDFIAFTRQIGRRFTIGVMRPDGSGERTLTDGYLVEGPSWAPNGRVIIFTREDHPKRAGSVRSRLYSIDLTGHNEQEIATPMDGSDPTWSPLMH